MVFKESMPSAELGSSDELSPEQQKSLARAFTAKAEKMELTTDERSEALLGEWITMDGQKYAEVKPDGSTALEVVVPKSIDSVEIARGRLKQLGTWCENNGVLARVNHRGEMLIAPYTKYRVDALTDAGYEHGSFGVPMSASGAERPLDPDLQARWVTMRDTVHKQNLEYKGLGRPADDPETQ